MPWTYDDEVMLDLCHDYVVAAQAEPVALANRIAAGDVGTRAYYEILADGDERLAEKLQNAAELNAFTRRNRGRN